MFQDQHRARRWILWFFALAMLGTAANFFPELRRWFPWASDPTPAGLGS